MNKNFALLVVVCFALYSVVYAQGNVKKHYDISFLFGFSSCSDRLEKVGFMESTEDKTIHEEAWNVEKELADLIQQHIAPESWKQYPNRIICENGDLYVIQTMEVHKQIEQLLCLLRQEMSRQIVLKVQTYEMDTEFFGQQFSQLANAQIASSLAVPSDRIKLIENATLLGFPNQSMQVARIRKVWYLRDRNPEIAEGMAISDPVTGLIQEGSVYHFVALPTPDAQHIYLQGGVTTAECKRPLRIFEGTEDLGKWQLPVVSLEGIMGSFYLPVAQASVLGIYSTDSNKVHIVLVTAQVAAVSFNQGESNIAVFNTPSFSLLPQNYQLSSYISPSDVLFQTAPLSPKKVASIINEKPGFAEVKDTMSSEKMLLDILGEEMKDSIRGFMYKNFLVAFTSSKEVEKVSVPLNAMFARKMQTNSFRVSCYQIKEAASDEFLKKFADLQKLTEKEYSWLVANAEMQRYVQVSGLQEQKVIAYSLLTHSFVKDYDVEVAKGASILDPVIGCVSEGISLEIASLGNCGEKDLLVEINGNSTRLNGLSPIAIGNGKTCVEHPDVDSYPIQGRRIIRLGENALVSASQRDGKWIVFAIRRE